MGLNPFSKMLRFLLSVLGLGFLAGSLMTLKMTDQEGSKNPREELARRLRKMADRIEEDETTEDEATDGAL